MLTDTQKDVLKLIAERKIRATHADFLLPGLYQDTDESRSFLFGICQAIFWGECIDQPEDVQEHARLSKEFLISLAIENPVVLANLHGLLDVTEQYTMPYKYSSRSDRGEIMTICRYIVGRIMLKAEEALCAIDTFNSCLEEVEKLWSQPQQPRKYQGLSTIRLIKEKLNGEALQSLSKYLDQMLVLTRQKRDDLIDKINNQMPALNVEGENNFVQDLLLLLNQGVTLRQLVSVPEQDAFVARANFIVILLKDKIVFEYIAQLSTDNLDSLIKTYGEAVSSSVEAILDSRKVSSGTEAGMAQVRIKMAKMLNNTAHNNTAYKN